MKQLKTQSSPAVATLGVTTEDGLAAGPLRFYVEITSRAFKEGQRCSRECNRDLVLSGAAMPCVQEKAARCAPGVPAKQSYLRVSLGVPSGCSPGIPYVLEIWPSGHFSPVHNHGNAFGIVRILHGSITGGRRSPDTSSSACLSIMHATWLPFQPIRHCIYFAHR